jgi:arabinan endo-1,5-alpha-L-arabinosidase
MVLHVRQLFFTPDGWPVASPQRYAGAGGEEVSEKEISGEWELIRISESAYERQLEAGQIMWGEGALHEEEWNRSFHVYLNSDGSTDNNGSWRFEKKNQTLTLTIGGETIANVTLFHGQDWENQKYTLLLTGLDDNGRSVWGKRIK